MQAKNLTEAIKDYMERDDIGLQALVLYGEWGSGKTYYCEHDLKAALNKMDVKTCRVSLFGVSNYDEALNRVITSRLPLSDKVAGSVGTALAALIKNAIKAGSSFFSNKIGDLGIQLSLKPELLLPLLDMKNVLVIFDDCERSNFTQDDRMFFGFINNMVENYGWHVMLVRNKPLSFVEDCSIEKAVMSQIAFEPDFQELYTIAIQPKMQFPEHIDFDVEKAILDGIKGSTINARAMARSIPAINCVLETPILFDETIDSIGRARALSSFIGYAIQASAGITPKKPNTSSIAVNMIDDSKVLECEDYLLISKALAPLIEGGNICPTLVEDSFREFVLAKNPESAADLKARSIIDQWHTLRSMEDNQVESFANRLEDLLSDGQYSHRWFPEIVSIALALKKLGFWDESHLTKLLDSLKRASRCDSQCSANALRQEIPMLNGFYGKEVGQIMDALVTRIDNEEKDKDLNPIRFELTTIDQNTGSSISSFLDEAFKSQCPSMMLGLPAECVVKSIYEGDADSQLSLQSFFHNCMKEYPDNQSLGDVIDWLRSIEAQLDEVGSKSRMGRLRSTWIREDIKEAIDTLRERSQSKSKDPDENM